MGAAATQYRTARCAQCNDALFHLSLLPFLVCQRCPLPLFSSLLLTVSDRPAAACTPHAAAASKTRHQHCKRRASIQLCAPLPTAALPPSLWEPKAIVRLSLLSSASLRLSSPRRPPLAGMTSHLPSYDLTRVAAAYSEPAKERGALLTLSRAAQQAERWDDMLRFAREIVRTAQLATPGADLTPEERLIFFTATKQVGGA